MNRRSFFKILSWVFLIPISILSYLGIKKDRRTNNTKEIFVPQEIANKYEFYENIIISKSEDQIQFYSNKCTHLGCLIKQSEDGKYLCSCHGSQFDKSGIPLQGPATKPLKKLNYSFIPEKNGYLVIEKT
jgi:Rieske Fe-S protein